MKAENYVAEWLDNKYNGAKDLDGWTPENVCRFADDFAKQNNEQLNHVILFGLGLIALAESFDIDLGKGWQNFKQMAKSAGIEYKFKEQ